MKSYHFLHGALLYQITCLELELGVHSVSTVNIAPLICWKKKNAHFPKGKGGFPSIFSFDMLYAQIFKLEQALTSSTFTDLSEWC